MVDALFIQYQRKPRQFFRELFVQQRFDVYDDQQLRARYRVGQAGIRYLEKLLGDDLRTDQQTETDLYL